MSMFSTMSKFIQSIFTTATRSVESLDKGLDILNHYVSEKHQEQLLTITTQAQLNVAAFNADVDQQLDSDASLSSNFDAVKAAWKSKDKSVK
jgi:hypothetical protein